MSNKKQHQLDCKQMAIWAISLLYHHENASEQASVIYRTRFGLHAAAVSSMRVRLGGKVKRKFNYLLA